MMFLQKSKCSLVWLNLIAAVCLFSGSTAFAATDYYVSSSGSDLNTGIQSAPFKTIGKAASVAQPGSTVHVAQGSYPGDITTTVSGTAASRIIFVSDTKWGAKIVGSGATPNDNNAGWWNRGDYVDIIGFEIDGTNAPKWHVGLYQTGSNSGLKNNNIHDILKDPSEFSAVTVSGNGGAGLQNDNWYAGVNGYADGNVIYNIGPSGQTSNLVHGIYETMDGTVSNNIVYNVVGAGITAWHDAHDINFVNNVVYNSGSGIDLGSGDSGVGGSTLSSIAGDYLYVANNIVLNSHYGLYEEGATGPHNIWNNNIAFGNDQMNIRMQTGTQSGNLFVDPKLVNPGLADFHPQSGSPAIDAGTPVKAPSTDYAGNARPQGAGYDIGAYEMGSTGGTSVTPPQTGPCTNAYISSVAVPTGYGAAYNLFSTAKELTVQADCTPTTPVLNAGSGAATQYLYKQAYAYKGGTWQPINLTGSGALISSNWYAGSAQGALPLTATDLSSNWNYIVAYICTWSGTVWKCGCADTACASSNWQLQAVKR